ncbi:hypothetical protein J0X14_12960 [Muricauda sp. CAU 1633]|uniref:hypothetical protein n=1 Tax=Allomuricauda sp. CAU 1633 TaxID=2816036 RepID=UPI001A8EE0EC|nr:hypothetical protein [Muricauda sp. CAU 1633]MBO0323211.1 hypothetical protein [Muricauda sp. CAU 1633]
MKKMRAILSFLFFTFLLVSCGSDDSGGEVAADVQVIGIWDLAEVNISSAQDIDMDGTSSTNLLDELDCISGTILIDGDNVWTFEQTDISVTPITGGEFFAQCNDGSILGTGAWVVSGNQIAFQGSATLGILDLSGDRLTNDVGDDLPGIQSYVYVRRE